MGNVEDRAFGSVFTARIKSESFIPSTCSGGAADSQRDEAARLDGHARLANLPRRGEPALVDDRPRGADGPAKRRGQFLGHFEVLFLLDSAANGDKDFLLGDVDVAAGGQDVFFGGNAARGQRGDRARIRPSPCPPRRSAGRCRAGA